jgi:hypothetical protein
MHESILSVVGNTPMVELRRLFAGEDFRVFAKPVPAKLRRFSGGSS